jgi:hypothetical protein
MMVKWCSYLPLCEILFLASYEYMVFIYAILLMLRMF